MNRDKQSLARMAARDYGVPMGRDFHTLRTEHTEALCDVARAFGYRKPRNASGSLARCFYSYLNRGV